MWTITRLRLRRNRRGSSSIIVVVLSLVIIVVVVSNIVLWSYEMNQLDWEKMKEDVDITNVERVNRSSWFVAQSEYTVNVGSRVSGSYTDTQTVDSQYEQFREGLSGLGLTMGKTTIGSTKREKGGPKTYLLHVTAPEAGEITSISIYVYVVGPPANTWDAVIYSDDGGAPGSLLYNEPITFAAIVDAWNTVNLTTPYSMTAGEELWIGVSIDDEDFGYAYDTVTDAGAEQNAYLPDPFGGNVRNREYSIYCTYTPAVSYSLNIDGVFVIDLATYPLASIQSVEIQLRYEASDSGENWYLKAYNWTAMTYSDNGFNSTTGHTPTTGWDYYAVNLTDKWRSYVQNDGTIYVKVVDEGSDNNKTTIDIDFLGVRAVIDGTRFTFKNEGSLTCHLVSVWIINSTNHRRYDINVFVNSAETTTYLRADISLPAGQFRVKVVTKRGNIAVYSGS